MAKRRSNERPMPPMIAEYMIFNLIDQTLKALETGVAPKDEATLKVVYRKANGELAFLTPAFQDWLYQWTEISNALRAGLKFEGLKNIERILRTHDTVSPALLKEARQEEQAARLYYRKNRLQVVKAAKAAQIKKFITVPETVNSD